MSGRAALANARRIVVKLGERLRTAGVARRGGPRAHALLPGSTPATDADGDEEHLDLVLGVKVVHSLKLHARGPMGADELTCAKWVVTGAGQVRV